MFSIETMLLGLALSLDAAIAAFALGILNLELKTHHKILRGLGICLLFGSFQFLMMWGGGKAGYYLSFSSFGHLFQLIVSVVFLFLGIKITAESFNSEEMNFSWGILSLAGIAFATSVDALGAGLSLGPLPMQHLVSAEIGILTFLVCSISYGLTFFLSRLPHRWLLRIAGAVFFFLSLKILFDHYYRG